MSQEVGIGKAGPSLLAVQLLPVSVLKLSLKDGTLQKSQLHRITRQNNSVPGFSSHENLESV